MNTTERRFKATEAIRRVLYEALDIGYDATDEERQLLVLAHGAMEKLADYYERRGGFQPWKH